MGRRRRSSTKGWGILFGVVLVLALVGLVIELVRAFWWAFLIAGTVLTGVWLLTRPRGRISLRAESPRAAMSPLHTVPTLRGDLVRSRGEARIADFLHRRGIDYQYEPTISGFRPDFFIPEWNLIIEYWGLDTPEYRERRRVKTKAYFANGYKLVGLESKDWPDLEGALARKLYYFDQSIYQRASAT